MLVGEYVVPAIAVLTVALGTVAEIHIGMGLVCNSADRTTMKISTLFPRNRGSLLSCLSNAVAYIHVDVPGKKDKEIADRGENQESTGPSAKDQHPAVSEPGQKRKPLDLDRQYEKDQQLKVGKEKGKGKKNRAVYKSIGHRHFGNQKGNGHCKQEAGQDEQVVAECAPKLFQRRSHEVEQVPGEQHPQRVAAGRIDKERKKPPPFPMEEAAGGKPDLIGTDLTGHDQKKENRLAGDQVDRCVRYRVSAKFFLQPVQQSHCCIYPFVNPFDVDEPETVGHDNRTVHWKQSDLADSS
jgi:hypothetical protein